MLQKLYILMIPLSGFKHSFMTYHNSCRILKCYLCGIIPFKVINRNLQNKFTTAFSNSKLQFQNLYLSFCSQTFHHWLCPSGNLRIIKFYLLLGVRGGKCIFSCAPRNLYFTQSAFSVFDNLQAGYF